MENIIWSWSGLVLGFIGLVLIVLIFKNASNKGQYSFAIFCIAPTFFGFIAFFIGITKQSSIAMLLWKIGLWCPLFAPVMFYHSIVMMGNLRRKKVLIILYLYATVTYLLSVFNLFGLRIDRVYDSLYYPTATDSRWLIFFISWTVVVLFCLSELYTIFMKASTSQRKPLYYLIFGSIMGFTGAFINGIPFFKLEIFPIGNSLIAIYLIMVTYAILQYNLLDITIVIKKTLIYSVLISVLSIIYFVLVYLIEKAFSVAMGYQSAILTVLAIVVLAIIFTPLKNRIQHAIDKYFFKGSIGEIEQEKHLLEDEIGRSERLKTISSLAAGMAHEIKNPLTSIKTFVEYVDKKYSDPEFKEKFKSIVPKEIDKIANIINQLLDYSKVDRISLRKVDIHKLLGYVTDLHSNEFIIKNIEAKISYEATNPIIKCDENKIKQAFINLILNSIEAMKKGGELSIHTKDIDNDIEIIIKDTGYGIAKDKLNKIFDPFFTTKEAGTGLGLFIVHQIVHNNNGKIGIESTEGRGTTIRVRFPRVI